MAMKNALATALEVDHDIVVEARFAGDIYAVYRARQGEAWALYHECGATTVRYANDLARLLRIVHARVPITLQKDIAQGLLAAVTRAA